MVIYDSLGNKILDTPVLDRSGLYCSIDNTKELTLYFSLDSHVEIPVGSYCTFEGNRYEVMSDDNVRMNHTKSYDYTVVLSSDYTLTSRYKVRHTVDRRLKFDMTAKPAEHLKMIVDNLNQRDSGWSIGECIDAEPKLVSYNHTKCSEALKMIAETFETELEVIGKSVSLKKVEYYKDSPLALAYGKGNGFRPGIQKVKVKDGLPVERLFIQGGSRNISLKDYGSSELHLPAGLSFKFDGSLFDWEDGFNASIAKEFKTDSDGSAVELKSLSIGTEDSLDLSEIYPKRVGDVSNVLFLLDGKEYTAPDSAWTEEQWDRVQVDVVDDSIPASLDYKACLIEGESLTVIFQSGMLAGRELQANYIASSKRFELVKQEIDGQPMPQNSFVPAIGDTYAVFNVSLPAAYVSDATTHSGAEYDALREASIYLYENCVKKFTFTGELDDIWSKKNWSSVGPRIRLGSHISFSHESMFPDAPAVVRIVGITQYVNNPYAPKIEISNAVGSTSVSSRINKIENSEAHVTELYEDAKRYAKRRFTDVQQTIKMLEAAIGGFTEGINPITVETMLMLVGDNSLQYLFTASLISDNTVVPSFDFDSDAGTFSVSAAFIKHMTLGIDSISPVHSDDEYLRWALPAFASGVLESDKGYYLYAKVAKNSQTGVFVLSESALDLNADEGYYNLLVGILNSQNDEGRSFAPMYGFTEILPGQITTDNIRSSDGKTWLDLVKGILHLNDMAGVSGVKDSTKGDKSIAAWFGGLMQDLELDKGATNPARSVIRHDGTGYFANGLFSWDKDNGISLGNDQLKINYDGSVDFGGNIRIGSTGEETLDSLLTIVAGLTEMWYLDEDGNVCTDRNVIIAGDTSSGGEGEDTPASGIRGIYVNNVPYTDTDGDGFIDLGTISGGLDESALASYLITNNYVNSSAKITSLLGYTPANGKDYLPLSGGTLESNTTSTVLKIKGSTNAWIGYYGPAGYLGEIGYIGRVAQCTDADGNAKAIIHSGNIGSRAVLLDGGGTITRGNLIMSSTAYDVVTNKLYPRADDSYELGQTSRRWSTIYGVNGNFSGNVGIGTTSPQYKLDVNGVAKASALRTTYIGIDCDADGNTSGYGSEINRFGANLYLQNREGNLYLSHSAGTTYIRGLASITGAVTMSSTLGVTTSVTSAKFLTSGSYGLWKGASFSGVYTDNDIALYASTIGIEGNVRPHSNNSYTLGTSSYRWSAMYANISRTGSIDTSSLYYNNLNVVGWKKVAVDNKKATSSNVIISIRRQYNNSNNETYTFLVNCAYHGQTTITQIGGHANYRLITQIAVYNPTSPYDRAIYIYYNTTASNQVSVNCIGDFDAITPESATLPSSNVKTMSTVSTGFATTGNGVIAGDTSSGSDIRFKDIIKNKTIKIEDIAKAPLFTFKWNDREDDVIHLGSSAQYWEKVCPWLVTGEDFKSLNYGVGAMGGVISLARHDLQQDKKIKALKRKEVNHEARIKELERKVKSLEEENRRLRYGS